MRRWTVMLALSAALIPIIAVSPARAAGPRPRIVHLEWSSRPLTAGAVETLKIEAIDPDGVVTTANVAWGDGVLTHADLICFGAGELATVMLSHVYREPGIYRVAVRVQSGPRCFTTNQASPTVDLRTAVRPQAWPAWMMWQ